MSIMTLFRRAFGFSPETEEEEGEYDPTVPTYAVSNQTEENSVPSAQPPVPPAGLLTSASATADEPSTEGPETDKKLTDDLFDAVIDLFNRTQPEFVRECLNVDAQRRYILNSLSDSLRQRVNSALSTDSTIWEKEKEELEKKIAELQGDDNETERLRKENRKLQLSVDRQKRALLDRINDLETQLTKQAQEKERYYARKGLTNPEELDKANARIKVLETEAEDARSRNAQLDGTISTLEHQIKELEAKLAEQAETIRTDGKAVNAEPAGDASTATPEQLAELENLKTTLEQEKSELLQEKSRIEEEKTALQEEKSRLEQEKSSIEEAKAKAEQEMASRQSDMAGLEEANAQLSAQFESLREELARQTTLKEQLEVKTTMSDAMINDLRNQAAASRNELERMQQEQEAVLTQIQQQLDGFEDLKARKDAKISELQESNASLRRTVETNLYNQANSEMKLRREIKDLKAEITRLTQQNSAPADTPSPSNPMMPEPAKAAAKRRGRPKKNRIDSDLDNTEWFAGSSAKRDDPDFGYHEPPRKPTNDNEAQLSLF